VNPANVLTVVRLVLTPVVVGCLVAGGTWGRALAFVAFFAASMTDLFDGRIARSRGLVTDFGKIADPVADKVLTGSALVTLSALGWLPWWVTVVVLVREIGITALRLCVVRREVIAASRGGKLKTILLVVAISLYILPGPLGLAREVTMVAAVVATLVTGGDYLVRWLRPKRPGNSGPGP
jgi:CDP-diacylglycerol--glycerol-3-phosphate 3-phosphatidyltransferase